MSHYYQLKIWSGFAICALGMSLPVTADLLITKTNSPELIFQLGLDSRVIQITPEYKESALQATLPLFSDFAQKLQLPVSNPLTKVDIVDCRLTPFQKVDGEIDQIFIETKEGFSFSMFRGAVRSFSWPNSYRAMQGIHGITNFYGKVKISREQAIQSARETLKKIGIQLQDIFAEQEPQIALPTWGTNTINRYLIKWRDPRGGSNAPDRVIAEVNTETGRVESLQFSPVNGLQEPAPKVPIIPPHGNGIFESNIPPPVDPQYAWKLVPLIFAAVDEYGQKLSLPIPRPLTTNDVVRIEIHNNEGWPHAEITLSNGWRFIYRHSMVNGYYASDNFFDSDNRKIHIKDFDGKWNLATNQAIAVVATAIAKLGYPTNNVHMDFPPNIYFPTVNKDHIPRLRFEWYFSVKDELQSRLEAEVNADNGSLESLYYDDKAFWNRRPAITIPISGK